MFCSDATVEVVVPVFCILGATAEKSRALQFPSIQSTIREELKQLANGWGAKAGTTSNIKMKRSCFGASSSTIDSDSEQPGVLTRSRTGIDLSHHAATQAGSGIASDPSRTTVTGVDSDRETPVHHPFDRDFKLKLDLPELPVTETDSEQKPLDPERRTAAMTSSAAAECQVLAQELEGSSCKLDASESTDSAWDLESESNVVLSRESESPDLRVTGRLVRVAVPPNFNLSLSTVTGSGGSVRKLCCTNDRASDSEPERGDRPGAAPRVRLGGPGTRRLRLDAGRLGVGGVASELEPTVTGSELGTGSCLPSAGGLVVTAASPHALASTTQNLDTTPLYHVWFAPLLSAEGLL